MPALTHDEEITALWRELASAAPAADVDALLNAASTELGALLAFATDWDATAEAMRQLVSPALDTQPASVEAQP